jgi:hypothetical protein
VKRRARREPRLVLRFAPFLLFAAVVSLAARASADDGAKAPPASVVEIYSRKCEKGPFDEARLLELLRVELGAIGVSDVRESGKNNPAGPLPSDLLAAVVFDVPDCSPSTDQLTIEVVDRATAKTVERRMQISDVAYDERPRALAIAVAELLQASWAELELRAKTGVGIDVPPELRAALVERLSSAVTIPVAPQLPAPALLLPPGTTPAPHRESASFSATALVRAFPSRDTALLGAQAALAVPLRKFLTLHVGGDAAFGDAQVSLGGVHVSMATGSAGIAFAAGTRTVLEIGPQVAVGYAWASGSPSAGSGASGSSYSHFVALACLSGTVRIPADAFTALIGMDLGAAFAQASFLVDDARAAGIGGVMFGARLGAAFGI